MNETQRKTIEGILTRCYISLLLLALIILLDVISLEILWDKGDKSRSVFFLTPPALHLVRVLACLPCFLCHEKLFCFVNIDLPLVSVAQPTFYCLFRTNEQKKARKIKEKKIKIY